MFRKLAVGLMVTAVWPLVALGQVSINTVTAPTLATYTFNGSNCSTSLDLQWSYTAASPLPGGGLNLVTGLKVWATSGSCGDQQLSTDILGFNEVSATALRASSRGPIGSLTLANLPMFTVVDGGTNITCGDSNVQVSNSICGSIQYSLGTSLPYQHSNSLTITYDTKPPATPTITGASGQDSSAKVTFSAPSDAVTVTATAAQLDGGASVSANTNATTGSIVITNLINDVVYSVTLTATDAAGNQSGSSSAVEVTPVLTNGFFAVLRNDGSTETGNGGCAVAAGGLVPLGLLAVARALARRSAR